MITLVVQSDMFADVNCLCAQYTSCDTKAGLSCAEGSENVMQFNGSH